MKFCQKCGSLYFLKKQDDDTLSYHCRTCGNLEPRNSSDNCIYQSDIDKKDYMTVQMSQNPYIIRDPTLPRLSNVKCINDKCITNHSNTQFILLNSNNTKESDLIQYLQEIGKEPLQVEPIKSDDIVEYGEIHTASGNLPILKQNVLEQNSIKLIKFADPNKFQTALASLKSASNSSNLIPNRFIKNIEEINPVLSEISRQIISIKYDDINMKYMYICSTCGSSWKNIT